MKVVNNMKLKLISKLCSGPLIAVCALLSITSCGLKNDPSWTMRDNPLDSYDVDWHSPAWGTFGPGGKEYPYRPDAYGQPTYHKSWDTYFADPASQSSALRH